MLALTLLNEGPGPQLRRYGQSLCLWDFWVSTNRKQLMCGLQTMWRNRRPLPFLILQHQHYGAAVAMTVWRISITNTLLLGAQKPIQPSDRSSGADHTRSTAAECKHTPTFSCA